MHPYTYIVSLRVKHPTRDLTYLNSLLELEPKRVWKVGEQRTTPKGGILDGTYSESYWYTVITNDREESTNKSLEETLSEWTEKLSIHKTEFERIRAEEGTIEYFIWLYCEKNLGFDIDPLLLKNISSLGISLGVVCDPE